MTVEFASARSRSSGALRKRLNAPGGLTKIGLRALLVAYAGIACAIGGCGERNRDAGAKLTANAARELARIEPGKQTDTHSTSPQQPLPGGAVSLASQAASSDPASSNPADSANSAALPAIAIRSPAKPPAGVGASGSQQEPLATPVIHTVD